MFFFVRPGISLTAKGCPRPKGPKTPVFCDFPPVGVCSAKTQNVKICALFGRNFWVGRIFPPKVPLSLGNCVFSVIGPEFLSVPRGCPRPKGPRNPVFCDFLPVGVRSAKTQTVKTLRTFWEKLLGRTGLPPKSAPSSGKLRFSVFARNVSTCQGAAQGQKGLNPQHFAISRPWGSGRPKRKCKKVADNHPE